MTLSQTKSPEDPGREPDSISRRYFQERADGLRLTGAGRLMKAGG